MSEYRAKFGMTSLFPPCSEKELREFELSRQMTLPEDYRDFLLQWNGAYFGGRQPAFPYRAPKNDDDHGMIATFYGLGGNKGDITNDLRHAGAAYEFEERVPPRFLSIGRNAYGHRICISVDMPDPGSVFVWRPVDDYPEQDDEEPSEQDLTRVADSFREFFHSLYKNPDPVWW